MQWVESKMEGGYFHCDICGKKCLRKQVKVIFYFNVVAKMTCGTCAAKEKKENKDVLRIIHKTTYGKK